MNSAMTDAANPVYGWYGDDFTGATDTLATLARRGVAAFLFLDPPDDERLRKIGPVEAVGIASAVRSMTPEQMRTAMAPAAAFLHRSGVQLVHYKCCSTFDSAPQTGNIAIAMDVLGEATGATRHLIIGGQPSLGRYCAFGNLFAAGNGEVWRLDRHPTMSRHPSTPMSEADLRRHFAALGLEGMTLVPWTALDNGLHEITEAETGAILFDALSQAHISEIGRYMRKIASERRVLVTGASSVAEAFFHDRTAGIEQTAYHSPVQEGPVLAVAGSLSPLSARQVKAATDYKVIAIGIDELRSNGVKKERLVEDACAYLRRGNNILLTTAPDNDHGPLAAENGLATATAHLVRDIVERTNIRRLAVAGGDTSSHIVQNLGLWGLAYGWQHGPGVAVSIGRSDNPQRDGIQLLLKGGQMGQEDIFNSYARSGRIPAATAS